MNKLISVALASVLSVSAVFAAASHPKLPVDSYKPYAGFSYVVEGKQMVGWFETEGEACAVHVVMAEAGDETLAVTPVRFVSDVAAGDVMNIEAGDGALSIACTIDADAIKVVVQTRPAA